MGDIDYFSHSFSNAITRDKPAALPAVDELLSPASDDPTPLGLQRDFDAFPRGESIAPTRTPSPPGFLTATTPTDDASAGFAGHKKSERSMWRKASMTWRHFGMDRRSQRTSSDASGSQDGHGYNSDSRKHSLASSNDGDGSGSSATRSHSPRPALGASTKSSAAAVIAPRPGRTHLSDGLIASECSLTPSARRRLGIEDPDEGPPPRVPPAHLQGIKRDSPIIEDNDEEFPEAKERARLRRPGNLWRKTEPAGASLSLKSKERRDRSVSPSSRCLPKPPVSSSPHLESPGRAPQPSEPKPPEPKPPPEVTLHEASPRGRKPPLKLDIAPPTTHYLLSQVHKIMTPQPERPKIELVRRPSLTARPIPGWGYMDIPPTCRPGPPLLPPEFDGFRIKVLSNNDESQEQDDELSPVADSIPEHLPSSPLCPRNPRHKLKGMATCPVHGRNPLSAIKSASEG